MNERGINLFLNREIQIVIGSTERKNYFEI